MMETSREEARAATIIAAAALVLFMIVASPAIAAPTGPDSINITSNTTKSTTTGQIVNISGGYLAKLNITATTQNPHWKAFAGWVNGVFTLDDATGSTIYDWTLTTVNGEVYATRDSGTIEWTLIQCANVTHIETENTALEHTSADDNITTTFTGTNSDTFVTAGTTITAGSCNSTHTYVNNVTQSSEFEESVLYDNTSIVYATVIGNATGYDGNAYDFQMIVPENGNESNPVVTAYYVYIELG